MANLTGIRQTQECRAQLTQEQVASRGEGAELSEREKFAVADACHAAPHGGSVDQTKYYQAARELHSKYLSTNPPSYVDQQNRTRNLEKVTQVVLHPLDTAKSLSDGIQTFLRHDVPQAMNSARQSVGSFFGQIWG
ncbi:MAG: hypothetical protein K8R69_07165 [Deltaproteobacteria bacterium]|nr:hypothetical protein [Deltaproteobacteria bacterium]